MLPNKEEMEWVGAKLVLIAIATVVGILVLIAAYHGGPSLKTGIMLVVRWLIENMFFPLG